MTGPASILDRIAVVSDEVCPDFEQALAVCLPLGIRAYELRNLPGGRVPFCEPESLEAVKRLVKEHALTITGLSPGFFKRKLDDPFLQFELNQGLDAAFRALENLGVTRMTVFGFTRTAAHDLAPAQAIDLLSQAARRCQQAGVELVLENSTSCWADTGKHQSELAAAAEIGVTWDPANAQAAEENAFPDGYHSVRPLIRHVHLRNWSPDTGIAALVGGKIDYPVQLKALEWDGYRGYYCLEPHQWERGADAVRENYAQLRTMLIMGEK